MAIRTISLLLTEEGRDAPALDAAAALARREDAHLDVVALGLEPVPLEALPMASAQIIVDTGRQEAEARAAALAGWATGRLPPDLRATVRPLTLSGLGLAGMAAQMGRMADLSVIARPYGRGHGTLAPALAEGLLFGTGAPVLVVPDAGCDLSQPWERVCLAWNDGDEALRAARASLPFLQQARQVDIALVAPPLHAAGHADPGEAVSVWLSRHGVSCEVAVLARTEPRVADVLLRFAAERGCGALVAGAFGHSRLREAVLGGATRDLLASAPLPLLMAH